MSIKYLQNLYKDYIRNNVLIENFIKFYKNLSFLYYKNLYKIFMKITEKKFTGFLRT